MEASLVGLSEQQIDQICDEAGWSIKDHLAHIAHWEEVLLMMFLDVPFEETMRIPWGRYPVFEDVNQTLRRQWADFTPHAILNRMRRVHRQLMAKLSPLSEEELLMPLKQVFPNLWIPEHEQRNLAEFTRAHTDNHYRDHAACIETMKASAR